MASARLIAFPYKIAAGTQCPNDVYLTQDLPLEASQGRLASMKHGRSPKADQISPKALMDYDRWVTKHLDELVRKCPGKVIAVYRGELIAVGDTYKEVFTAARAQGITEQPFAMEVPRPEDFEAIL